MSELGIVLKQCAHGRIIKSNSGPTRGQILYYPYLGWHGARYLRMVADELDAFDAPHNAISYAAQRLLQKPWFRAVPGAGGGCPVCDESVCYDVSHNRPLTLDEARAKLSKPLNETPSITCNCGPNECCQLCQIVGGNGSARLRYLVDHTPEEIKAKSAWIDMHGTWPVVEDKERFLLVDTTMAIATGPRCQLAGLRTRGLYECTRKEKHEGPCAAIPIAATPSKEDRPVLRKLFRGRRKKYKGKRK
jgi:hypothetical protein